MRPPTQKNAGKERRKKNLEGERTERVETATAKSLEMKRREGEGVLRRKGKLSYFRRSVNRVKLMFSPLLTRFSTFFLQ